MSFSPGRAAHGHTPHQHGRARSTRGPWQCRVAVAFTGQLLSPQCFGPSDPLCGPCSFLRTSGPAQAQWPPRQGGCGERRDALRGWTVQWPSQGRGHPVTAVQQSCPASSLPLPSRTCHARGSVVSGWPSCMRQLGF